MLARVIVPASLTDASRAAALIRATSSDRLGSDAGTRYRMATALPEERMGYWKAEDEGELVGWAIAGLNAFAQSAAAGLAGITVASSHRRRGIGGALWDQGGHAERRVQCVDGGDQRATRLRALLDGSQLGAER